MKDTLMIQLNSIMFCGWIKAHQQSLLFLRRSFIRRERLQLNWQYLIIIFPSFFHPFLFHVHSLIHRIRIHFHSGLHSHFHLGFVPSPRNWPSSSQPKNLFSPSFSEIKERRGNLDGIVISNISIFVPFFANFGYHFKLLKLFPSKLLQNLSKHSLHNEFALWASGHFIPIDTFHSLLPTKSLKICNHRHYLSP